MRRFVVQFSFFACVFCVLVVAAIIGRVALWQDVVRQSYQHSPQQNILMIGDSHVGCTFVEEECYHNKIIWESSMPQQFTLMRLKDMERLGALDGIDVVVIEFGLQNIGQQRVNRMDEMWWRMLPVDWRYSRFLPDSWINRLLFLAQHPRWKISVASAMPTSNVKLLDQSTESQQKELRMTTETHFGWQNSPGQLCHRWNESLRSALTGIVEICKRNKIRIVFLTAPLSSPYRKSIPVSVEKDFQEFVHFIKFLGTEYYDFRSWGDDLMFRDSFHFHLNGAKEFSEYFFESVINGSQKSTGVTGK